MSEEHVPSCYDTFRAMSAAELDRAATFLELLCAPYKGDAANSARRYLHEYRSTGEPFMLAMVSIDLAGVAWQAQFKAARSAALRMVGVFGLCTFAGVLVTLLAVSDPGSQAWATAVILSLGLAGGMGTLLWDVFRMGREPGFTATLRALLEATVAASQEIEAMKEVQ